MPARRSRPMLIAPLIPFWAILAFFGVELLSGTRYLAAFVVMMLMLLAALFAHVLSRALQARRARGR